MKKPIQLLALLPIFFSFPPEETPLAEYEISLENRYPNDFVNGVFKDNILLTLAYLRSKELVHLREEKIDPKNVNWDQIRAPFSYQFNLDPGKTFAFHDDILPKYKDLLVKHTNAHFNGQEGFKFSGALFGDGVCHLASLINIVAQKAGLEVEVPTKHDFREIPEIDKEYGVSIYSNPQTPGSNTRQNLYITNNKGKPISFKFEYNGEKVKVVILDQ